MKDTINNKESVGLLGPIYKVRTVQYDVLEKYGHVYSTEANDRDTWPLDCTNTYNEAGIRIEENRKHGKERLVKTFDAKGYQIERNDYLEDGSPKNKYIRKNNDAGKVIQDTGYDKTGKQTDRTTWEYNEKGDILKYVQYDKDEKINSRIDCYYGVDSNNKNYTENKRFDGEGNFESCYKEILNSKGQTVETIHLNEDGSIKDSTSHADKFDSDDNWIESFNIRNDIALYKTIVDKDHHENWIIKIDYFKNKPIYIHKRIIQYFGEAEIVENTPNKFEIPIKLSNPVTIKTEERTISDYKYSFNYEYSNNDLTQQQAKWIAEKSNQAENFPYLSYYMLFNDEIPSQLIYSGSNVEVIALLKEMTAYADAEIVHAYYLNNNNKGEQLQRYTLTFRDNKGYLIYITQIQESDTEEFTIPEFMNEYGIGDDGLVRTSQIIILYPSEASGKDKDGQLIYINHFIERCLMEDIPEKPEIYMVEVINNNFSLDSHFVNDDFEITDLDINYGYGFEQFHTELIQRFTHEHKGLVLFHGIPGTGKTYYIRHLLREMALANKIVIYMPPNMVDYLSEPEFMTFLSKTVSSYSQRNLTCVLLIEDAEPLLVARHNEGRVQGITNLLNISDGLLNDMLKLQIICTFNVDLKQLDSALLRPGRLIARKEFKALPELDANILGQRLGIKYHFDEPATLSEIYAKIKNQNTIIHEEY